MKSTYVSPEAIFSITSDNPFLFIYIGVTDLTITQARSTVVSFPNPITMIYHSVFIQNPKEGIHLKAYTDPLQYLSWVMIGVYCLVVPPILFIAARYLNISPLATTLR